MDMNEVATNLVPYPRLHYIFSSVSPITLSAPNMCTMQKTKYIALSESFIIINFKLNLKIKI